MVFCVHLHVNTVTITKYNTPKRLVTIVFFSSYLSHLQSMLSWCGETLYVHLVLGTYTIAI